jgi:hypothetical protein
MKFFITIFALLALLGSPLVFAEDSKEAATTADSESEKKADDKKDGDKKADDEKASEEEPDCD